MTLSTAEMNAIQAFKHNTVNTCLTDRGWVRTGVTEHDHWEFTKEDKVSVWVPFDLYPFDWCDNEELITDFAESEDISTFEAIAVLGGGKLPWAGKPMRDHAIA